MVVRISKLKMCKGQWTDKVEIVINEFSKYAPNLKTQAKTASVEMDQWGSGVFQCNNRDALDANYNVIALPGTPPGGPIVKVIYCSCR